MNEIIKLLMERDGISESEAIDIINDTKSIINDALEEGNIFEIDDIVLKMLKFGLEMDYALDLLGY